MQANQDRALDKVTVTIEDIKKRLASFRLPDLDMIVGIGSGGRVPAALIAGKLGLPVKHIEIKYRMENNQPLYEQPRLLRADEFPQKNLRLLLVDDVSVSGKTIQTARQSLTGHIVTTFVLKGKADFVLFPEIKSCVNWPWHTESQHSE